MKDFKSSYKNLNQAQKQAVDAIEGPVMVVAGPGTGKTTLLTLRIANILQKTDIAPENILALTFTNSGVHAMRKKLIEYIGDDAYRVGIFTFHSFAENIIKEFSFYFPSLEHATVITDLQKIQILEEIIAKGKYVEITSKHDIFASLNQVKNAIDSLKQEGLQPDEFVKKIPEWNKELLEDDSLFYKRSFGKYKAGDMKPAEKEKIDKKVAKASEIADVFKQYQQKIEKENLYDFSDMILSVLRELESNQNLKLDLQEQYQYLLVDEHQDTNEGQNRLIELLSDAEHLNRRPNLFTVGDEKQSIYRFQGASDTTFTHFQEIYSDVQTIFLEENYRSTPHILDASYSLIDHSISGTQKLYAQNKDATQVHYSEFSNYKFELLHLAEEIQKKIESGCDPREIAVIYRSNKQINDIKQVFSQKKIPHTVLSNEYLLQNSHIQNILTLLRVINNPHNNNQLGKALFVDFMNLDVMKVLEILQDFQIQNRSGNRPLFVLLAEHDYFKEFVVKITQLKTHSKNKDFGSFFKTFLDESGYLEHFLQADDSRDQLLRVDKLFDEIKRQMATKKNYTLDDFIQFIESYEKYNLDIATQDPEVVVGVQCMTAHKSKGLEFEYVYMLGAIRKNWEKSRGFNAIALPIQDYKGDIHDERRLFYVAMTRAKKELSIISSKTDWEGREQDKSQFVTEIDEKYIQRNETHDFEKKHLDELQMFISAPNMYNSVFDSQYLAQLFLENNLSVTSLNNYLSCPIKYLFRNLIQLPSEYSANLVYGDVIHNTLEKFFEVSKEKKKIETKKTLTSLFEEQMQNSQLFGDEYDRYRERGKEALIEYYEEYKKEWSVNVENEKYIRRDFTLRDGQMLTLSGRIDKVEFLDSEIEGKVVITDYKTGKPFSDKARKSDKEDLKRQLAFYYLLYEGYADGKFSIEKAVLDFVEKNKKGEFEQYTVAVSDDDLNKLKEVIQEMSQEVLHGEFLKKGCEQKDCEYCHLMKVINKK